MVRIKICFTIRWVFFYNKVSMYFPKNISKLRKWKKKFSWKFKKNKIHSFEKFSQDSRRPQNSSTTFLIKKISVTYFEKKKKFIFNLQLHLLFSLIFCYSSNFFKIIFSDNFFPKLKISTWLRFKNIHNFIK